MLNSSHEIAKNKMKRLIQTESERERKRETENISLSNISVLQKVRPW